uniref:C-type lectin domain-containing protein n=1 Tax=Panagrolaimus davidi TaxID=227884 RepID=A0A914NYH4_9BILA
MLYCLFYFCSLILISKAVCPNGSVTWQTNCFYFVKNETGFATAEIACNNLDAHLVSIHDAFVNVILGEEAVNYFHGSTETNFWIGADNLQSHGTWTWTDGTPFDFNDWNKGEPQNVSGFGCAALSMVDGTWSAQDCFKSKPYVCLLSPTNSTTITTTTVSTATTPLIKTTTTHIPSCPQGWSFYNFTGFCYSVFHNQNEIGAEQVCKREGGHLASIHSQKENDFIGNLPFQAGHIWIGLYTIDQNANWLWTDETLFDYSNWKSGEPNSPGIENCVEMDGSYPYTFNNVVCGKVYTNFVCKKLPS